MWTNIPKKNSIIKEIKGTYLKRKALIMSMHITLEIYMYNVTCQ